MSQSHEPSYYEIALTNRQVLVVFVVLLICVVASFFSGVWIGRRAGGVTAEGQVAELAVEEGGDEPTEGEEPALRRLRFFTDERDQGDGADGQESEDPPLAEIIEEPSPETTLLEDVSQRGSGDGNTGVAASEPPPSPPVVTPPITTPPAGTTPSATTAEPTSGHVVQVFSSTDEAQAQRLVERLGNGGFPAFISPFEDRGQIKYRVRVGPYRERSRADEAADRLRREFRLDTWVTQLQ